MKKLISLIISSVFFGGILFSVSTNAQVVEDLKPSGVNQIGKEFPQVNSEGRVRVQISAPEALKVQLDIGAVKYDLKKDEKGLWIGESCSSRIKVFTITS